MPAAGCKKTYEKGTPIRGCKRVCVKRSLRSFAKGSFRWVRSGRAWVLVGCPRGKWWTSGRCKVGTRVYKVVTRAKGCGGRP